MPPRADPSRAPFLILAGAFALGACGGLSLPFLRREPLELWAFADAGERRSVLSAERNASRVDVLRAVTTE